METGLIKPKSFTGLTEDGLNEYLLVITPNTRVYEKVLDEKKVFYEYYKEKGTIKTKPHIIIANFMAYEAMEETLIRYLHRIISEEKSFNVTLNNYSGVPPHTVYIRVQDATPFKHLAKQLKPVAAYIEVNTLLPMKLITRPQITIARSLTERVYEKAMLDFSQRIFHESFDVKELLLLRSTPQLETCKQVNVFRFK